MSHIQLTYPHTYLSVVSVCSLWSVLRVSFIIDNLICYCFSAAVLRVTIEVYTEAIPKVDHKCQALRSRHWEDSVNTRLV